MVKQKKARKDSEKSEKNAKLQVKVSTESQTQTQTENENENEDSNSGNKVDKSRKGFREPKKRRPIELTDEPIVYTKEMFHHSQCKVGEQLPFTCDRCFVTKKSRNKYTYTINNKIICNGCYGLLIGKGKEEIKRLTQVDLAGDTTIKE